MKITNTLLLAAVVATLGACEKSNTDTATPDDATAPATEEMPAEEPAADDIMGEEAPAEDMAGEEEAAEDMAEGDAEAPTAEE